MADLDRSIFRKRALEKYMQKQEMHTILRLVSPRIFGFLWAFILLAICAGAVVWSIKEPIVIQGKGVIVQQKAANGKKAQIVVLLLLPSDQQSSLKVGQPVSISIASANINFMSSIGMVEAGVMSPAAISMQVNLQLPASLAQTIAGPSIVASAPVEPMSLAQTYIGSQCDAQVQIGTQSAFSFIPGFNAVPKFFSTVLENLRNLPRTFQSIKKSFSNNI
jgi:hypothetical protein